MDKTKSPSESSAQDTFLLKAPKGTYDILPSEIYSWQIIESIVKQEMANNGYQEIRIPIFEHTELFKRSVGDTTDIINKEMYTFQDKSQRSLSLRPEGTAGVVRAYLNHGMQRLRPPVKLWYLGPMFRYESIKTGRQRQFNQIGLEAFGSISPLIDAEVIHVAMNILRQINIGSIELQINSIGCSACRPTFREQLRKYVSPNLAKLCPDCQDRFQRNPLRMLDCKIKEDQFYYQNSPACVDYLCTECQAHWDYLKILLSSLNIAFQENPRIVRGLDYYTKTVFEIVASDPRLGVESTLCAGGRYDNLVETLGGPPTPAVGWAAGIERLILLIDKKHDGKPQVFVVASEQKIALQIALELRAAGISCELDFLGGMKARNFGKQLESAHKSGANFAVIVGENELAAGKVAIKEMQSGKQLLIERNKLSDSLKEMIKDN